MSSPPLSLSGDALSSAASTAPLLVIAGPTASGKTGAALALARRLDAELVGADSVQVFRGFDIGSAKPDAAELGGCPHHLLDCVDPDAEIDAMDFARRADAAIAGIRARGRLPIVVGGTGLWIRALLRGLVDLPAVDAALRARLEQEVEALGPAAAHARLQAIDPLTAAKVHAHDALRIVRALEVYEQTGRALGELRAQHALGAPRYAFFLAVLDRPRAELEARMQARLDEMLARGWIEEVRALLSRWGPSARGFGSVGYRQIVEHLIGGVPLAQTQRKILRATRIYSRRQRTWFRSEPDVAFRGLPEALLAHPGLQSRERLDALIQGLPKSSGGH